MIPSGGAPALAGPRDRPAPAPHPGSAAPAVPAPDGTAVRVWELTLACGPITAAQAAARLGLEAERVAEVLAGLCAARLVRHCEADHAYRAVGPDTAQAELIAPLEAALQTKARELAGIQDQVKSLADTIGILRTVRLRHHPVVSHHDQGQVARRIAEAVDGCTSEILVMQPLPPGSGPGARPFGLPVPPPGVRMRVLCPRVPGGAAGAPYLAGALAAGARVRAVEHVPDPLVVVGQEAAFMPDPAAGSDRPAVAVVCDPAVISMLRCAYECVWNAGTDLEPADPSRGTPAAAGTPAAGTAGRVALCDTEAAILGLLAAGLKDDVVARRVGMSSRTFRRHIARLMGDLQASSRFQAGVAAACAGLVGPPGRPHRGTA